MRRDIVPQGPGWALWRWLNCRDGSGTLLIRRLTVVRTPWFEILVHWLRPDTSPLMHTHPWSFVSLILWGSYAEEVLERGRVVLRHRRWLNWKHCRTPHRVSSGRALTLILATGRWNQWQHVVPQGRCFTMDEDSIVGWSDREPECEVDFCSTCGACLACADTCPDARGHFWITNEQARNL